MSNCVEHDSKIFETLTSDSVSIYRNFSSQPNILRNAIEECFESFNTEENIPKLRVYWEKGQREDLKLKTLLNPKNKEEKITEWVQRCLGQYKNFCLVVNGISAWSPVVHNYIAREVIVPWISCRGKNFKPFDAYVFLGEYDITPFGIHFDDEDSILIHLGPNNKTIQYWPDFDSNSDLWRTVLRINRFDFSAYPSTPLKVTLKPGDLIRIPKGHPHVMTNIEYSVTLGVIPNPSSNTEAISQICDEISREMGPVKTPDGFQSNEDAIGQLSKHLNALSDPSNVSTSLDAQQKRMKSNGWLVPAPNFKHSQINEISDLFFHSDILNPLGYQILGEKITVFARGREFKLPNKASLATTLKAITEGEFYSLSTFHNSLKSEFDEMAINKIFQTFVQRGGLIAKKNYE